MDIPENDKKTTIKSWPVYLFLLLVLASSLWAIHKRRQAQPAQDELGTQTISVWPDEETVSSPLIAPPVIVPPEPEKAPAPAKADERPKPAKPAKAPDVAEDSEKAKRTAMQNIIDNRRGWSPVGMNWIGKDAEDFSFRAINDEKIRKLSDYRGKDVILAFWATYCPPCRIEVPHLKQIRKEIGPEKLEIIAISSESTSLIKRFAKSFETNYTMTSVRHQLPPPFSYVESIPTTFYVNEQGKIELIVVGVVSAEAAKEILAVSEK